VEGPSLSAASYTAFAVVFLVLSLLALVIHVIGLVLPARAPHTDSAVVAAIAAAVATQQPGAEVVHIEEIP
jgi:Na+-transporting methylmalonyl-CoA/oxaloacetate decarboxylase gamma subunit